MLVGSPLLSEYCSGSFAFSARQGSFSSCIIGGILFLSLMHFIVMPRGCMEPYSWHQTTLKFFHPPVEHSWYLPNDWILCSLLWPAGELQMCSRRKMTTYSGLSLGHLLLLYQKSGQSEQCREADVELKIKMHPSYWKTRAAPWISISTMRIYIYIYTLIFDAVRLFSRDIYLV